MANSKSIQGGFMGNAGAPAYNTLIAGGIPLRDLLPNAPSDIPVPSTGAPRYIREGEKLKLKDLFPARPGGFGIPVGEPGYEFDRRIPPAGLAGNPFGPAFEVPNKKPISQPTLPGEDKKMIEGVYGQPGLQPSPRAFPMRLPMAMGMPVVGNMAGFFGQGIPPGYINKIVS
jgi:hypothetical protein